MPLRARDGFAVETRVNNCQRERFFWACSGWYIEINGRRACNRQELLSPDDLLLFTNLKRPEFTISSRELTDAALDPARAERLRQALDSIRAEHRKRDIGIALYRCPVHGESMVMRRKNVQTADLLDEFFLGCPRWLSDGSGCSFVVKLKSAAQMSAVLDGERQEGLLATVN